MDTKIYFEGVWTEAFLAIAASSGRKELFDVSEWQRRDSFRLSSNELENDWRRRKCLYFNAFQSQKNVVVTSLSRVSSAASEEPSFQNSRRFCKLVDVVRKVISGFISCLWRGLTCLLFVISFILLTRLTITRRFSQTYHMFEWLRRDIFEAIFSCWIKIFALIKFIENDLLPQQICLRTSRMWCIGNVNQKHFEQCQRIIFQRNEDSLTDKPCLKQAHYQEIEYTKKWVPRRPYEFLAIIEVILDVGKKWIIYQSVNLLIFFFDLHRNSLYMSHSWQDRRDAHVVTSGIIYKTPF